MNEPRALRIGFVGLGWPGEQHAKAAMALPDTTVAAACDLQPERLQTFAGRFSPRKVYPDYDQMLADPEVDAVIISLPNFLHYSATLAALRAGKHVLCEKPPTLTVAEIRHIREEVRASGLTYFFGRQSRFSSRMLAAKKLVEEGRLGHVYFAKAERVRSRGIPAWGGGWFLEKSRSGGGAMIDIGVHALDAAWYLLGCPKPLLFPPRSVLDLSTWSQREFAMTWTTPDLLSSFEGDAVMHLEVAWAANVTDVVPVSTWAGHELENTTLYGSKGTLRYEPATLFTIEGTARKEEPFNEEAETNPFETQLLDFAWAVKTGKAPANGIDQAVTLMEMLTSIYRSSDTQKEVQLA